jgi:hypothetical protein
MPQSLPGQQRRSAQEVIDATIRENRKQEILLYGFAITSFLLGCVIIAVALYRNQQVAALAGAFVAALCTPAMLLVRDTRRENMKLRLMELPLSSARTAVEAADAVIKLFAVEFSDNKERKHGTPKTVRE